MPDADLACQDGDQPAALVPKEVLDEDGRGSAAGTAMRCPSRQEPATSRISMLDPGISIGISRATSSARSTLSAVTNMYPPTISFDSTNGPSVAADVVTTLPPGMSLPPISRILSLNFSFHALKAAYMSCICAGEGCCCRFPGWLRWRNRYFLDIGSPMSAPAALPAP